MSSDRIPEGYADTDIAVVGFAGRFPGASDAEAFWNNIRDGVTSVEWLSEDQLREGAVSDDLLADPRYVRASYAIDDMAGFDARFFGFSPREAAIMDPQQRHFLEVAWTALEHAGYAPERLPGNCGVFAGCGASLYLMQNLLTNPDLVRDVGFFLLRHTGNDKDFLATRVSYLFNLTGPSINVQTACSTSLVGVHLACQSLLSSECDIAIAGGSTIRQPARVGYLYKEGEIVSPDGYCRPFEARAKGTVFGSGSGAVILRRLGDALRDGDTVHAVIRGSAVNNDGAAKVGYLAPSVEGQALAVQEALAVGDVDPATVQLIECHGTATPVGDPIEVAALMQAYAGVSGRKASIALGSVKGNVGHLDTAAGVAGLIKVVQSLRHRVLPPTPHYEAPNPAIPFEEGPFYVNASARDWTTDGGPRRAGVSALGAGGTNAHVVLQEAPDAPVARASARAEQLLVLSARTPAALERRAADLAAFLRGTDAELADIAHTLQVGRQGMTHRRAVVATSVGEAVELLATAKPAGGASGESMPGPRPIALMFTGMGSQYPNVGRELYEQEPVYREAMDRCLALGQPLLDWDMRALLFPEADEAAAAKEMERPSRAMPCLFATQYAMAALLASWGLEAEAMIGHSMGEYTAAHLAGVFSLQDAIALVAKRGVLIESLPEGGMLVVPMTEAELERRLPPGLSIAAVNAPELSVASGPVELLGAFERQLTGEGIEARRVPIRMAGHSLAVEPILDEFLAFCKGIRMSAPTRPVVSNVSGTWLTAEEAADPAYWVRHLRRTVRFADGVETLLKEDRRILLEVGPGRTLSSMVGLHGSKRPHQFAVPSMRRPGDAGGDVRAALGALGRLWVGGGSVDWSRLYDGSRRRIPLPTYPFEHQPHFVKPGSPAVEAPSLARQSRVEDWFWRPSWTRSWPGPAAPLSVGARWLVFREATGLGAALAERLAAEGHQVVSVLPGGAFTRMDAATFAVDPSSAGSLAALVMALRDDGALPDRVVHAWGAGVGDVDTVRLFDAPIGLVKALAEAGRAEPMRLDVLTCAGQLVAGESLMQPSRALVLGPVRVLPKEFPWLRTRAIDLPEAAVRSGARALAQVLRELALDDGERIVAWRGGDRFVERFDRVRLEDGASAAAAVVDGDVVLITGGLGGIGLLMAEEIARQARVRLVLVGRRAVRSPAIDRIAASGADVMLEAADVADAEAMRRVVGQARERFGPITHVIHAAGVIEDALVMMKDAASARRVLAPKVAGTLAVDAATRDEPLKRFLLVSSRASYAGVPGQVDYTAASAFLDAWATQRSAIDGVPVLSVDWCAWEGVGVTARSGLMLPPGRDLEHPLLGRLTRTAGTDAEFHAILSPDTHWLLGEHRVSSGDSVIPGTGYLEILRAALAEADGAERVALREVMFVSPFSTSPREQRELRVRIAGEGEDREVIVDGRRPGAPTWKEHARASVAVAADAAPAALDIPAIAARCTARTVEFTGTEKRVSRLDLGPRWRNLRRVAYGEGEALAWLSLPEEWRSDLAIFRMHPALLDVATACAQALVPGFDGAKDFFVPVVYGSLQQFAPITADCVSHIRLRPGAGPSADSAIYDVTLAAPDGQVLVEVREFTMMRMRDGAWGGSGEAEAPVEAEVPSPARGLAPEEGVETFRRVLAADLVGNVVVSPVHLPAYLDSLEARADEDDGDDAAGPAREPVETGELEAVLATHEAVHQAVVIAFRDPVSRVGEATAFIVWDLGERSSLDELRDFLSGAMPEGIALAAIVELEQLPRDVKGAVDREALARTIAGTGEARDEIEARIHALWSKKLGVERIGRHENFFELGGHSLLFTQTLNRLRADFGVDIPLQALFDAPTIAEVAAVLRAATEAAAKGEGGPSVPALSSERDGSPLPASFAQWRLWFEDQLDPGRSMYNLPVALILRGAIDLDQLRATIAAVVARHEVLRTTLASVDGALVQQVADAPEVPFVHERAASLDAAKARVAEEAARPFDLAQGPLFRAMLVTAPGDEHILLVVAHHAMVDGYSMAVLLGEISSTYAARVTGKGTPASGTTIQYGDFARWQRTYVQGPVLERQLQWWRQTLAGELPTLALPMDRPRPAIVEHIGDLAERYLPASLQAELTTLARSEGTSAFVLLLTAFQLLLARLSGQQDVLVASPLANRGHPDLEMAVGMYVNTVVVRTAVGGQETFRDLLRGVKAHLAQIQANQDAPFDKVVEALQPRRDPSYHPIFQAMFSWQPAPSDRLALPGTTVEPLPVGGRRSPFDVWLDVQDGRQGARLALLYSVALFDPDTAARLLRSFEAVLRGVVATPDTPVATLPVMDPEERDQVLTGFNATETSVPSGTTPAWIVAMAERHPDAVAVEDERGARTYGELVTAARAIAAGLRARGVAEGGVVGILMERSTALVEALLGTWLAGAAYLPLDPSHPPDRLSYVVGDAGARLVLVDDVGAEVELEGEVERVRAQDLRTGAAEATPVTIGTADRAYLIYTSGSTGRPKGVIVSHGALANFLHGMRDLLHVDASLKALALTTPSFDIFGLECWLPLVVGGATVMAHDDAQYEGAELARVIAAHEVTLVQATPTTWRLLLGAGWEAGRVRYGLVGGESVPRELATTLAQRLPEAWNVYGPTETTIWSTAGRLSEEGAVSIGRPIANTQVYVMDRNGTPLPIGAIGELWIGGLGVAEGYHGRSDLTAERFVPDPFRPGARCYRTGDLGRWRADGTLECLGRLDGQVKVRGFRIELEEVEHVLGEHPAVRQAIAAVRRDATGTATLVAYLLRDAAVPVTGSELRRHAREFLPDYMVPSLIVELEAVPLTPNGKVDRKALPDPFAAAKVEARSAGEAPQGPTEGAIAGIWREMLGLEHVERRDSFFDLGGHSLLAMQMKLQVERQFGLGRLPATIIFRTLEQLAVEVDQAVGVAT